MHHIFRFRLNWVGGFGLAAAAGIVNLTCCAGVGHMLFGGAYTAYLAWFNPTALRPVPVVAPPTVAAPGGP